MCCSQRTDLWLHVCSPHTDTGHMHKHRGLLILCFSHAKQLCGADFGSCNKVSIPSAEPADATLEMRSCERVWKYSSTVKHQDTLCSCDTLLFIFSIFQTPPPRYGRPSWQLGRGRSLTQKKKKKEAAESAGARAPRQEPKLVSASQHVELACLGHSQMVLQLPLCPPSLSKQRTETN